MPMISIEKNLSRISIFSGLLSSLSIGFLICLIFVDVLFRYFLKTSWIFVQELEWHLFAFSFLFGASYTLKEDKHVRVDLFYQNWSKKKKAWVNLIGNIIFLWPGMLTIFYTSFPFVYDSFQQGEVSPDPGGIPYRFIVKGFVLIGFALLTVQSFLESAKAIRAIRE